MAAGQDAQGGGTGPTRARVPLLVSAALVLALLVTTSALAGAGEGSQQRAEAAGKSALKKKVRRLSKGLKQLQAQLDEVSQQTGPEGPEGPRGPAGPTGPAGPSSGPAGGDLAGSYPNPSIATGAVNSAKVADNSLSSADLGSGSVAGSEVADNSLFSADLGFNSVGDSELATNAVSSDELIAVVERAGPGTVVSGGNVGSSSASCSAGEQPLTWDARWSVFTSSSAIVHVDFNANTGGGVTVVGSAGTNATLTASVFCLTA